MSKQFYQNNAAAVKCKTTATAFTFFARRHFLSFNFCISEVGDKRRTSHGHVLHKFEDIIIIGLCAVISDGEDFADMEMFGRERESWLRRFLELPNGIPDADTFRRVFEAVDPAGPGACPRK